MKQKIAYLIFFLAVIALASCSSKPLCPAYSSVDTETTERIDSNV